MASVKRVQLQLTRKDIKLRVFLSSRFIELSWNHSRWICNINNSPSLTEEIYFRFDLTGCRWSLTLFLFSEGHRIRSTRARCKGLRRFFKRWIPCSSGQVAQVKPGVPFLHLFCRCPLVGDDAPEIGLVLILQIHFQERPIRESEFDWQGTWPATCKQTLSFQVVRSVCTGALNMPPIQSGGHINPTDASADGNTNVICDQGRK